MSAGPTADISRIVARRPALEARARVVSAMRAWFHDAGFLEVETPARVRAPGQEVHLDAIRADDRWLITSPEYHMKRLVAAGLDRIVQFGKAWRRGEVGQHHQPEFAIVEWYRAGEPLDRIARDCEELLRVAARAAGPIARPLVPLEAPFERTTVAALLSRHAGLELRGGETADELRAAALKAGIRVGDARTWDDLFFQIWLDRVEEHLGRERPTFVFDWPAPLAALARRSPGAPHIAERFELYAGGIELANAFGELTDAAEQRARFEEERRDRLARGRDVYPIDEELLAALPYMPETAGVALGLDRLVVLILGATDIRQVVAFADDEV